MVWLYSQIKRTIVLNGSAGDCVEFICDDDRDEEAGPRGFFIPSGDESTSKNSVACHGILGPGLAMGFIPLIKNNSGNIYISK